MVHCVFFTVCIKPNVTEHFKNRYGLWFTQCDNHYFTEIQFIILKCMMVGSKYRLILIKWRDLLWIKISWCLAVISSRCFFWSALQIQMKGSIMDHTIYTFVVSVEYNRHLWMYYGSYNFVCVDACPTKQLKHGECHIR